MFYHNFSGSLVGEYRQTDGGNLSYLLSYDSDGNKVEKTSINGQTKTITTGTDEDGKSYVSNDGVTAKTITDDFGRTTEVKTSRGEGNSVYFTQYEYADGKAENSTTNLVSKLTQKYGNNELVNYEYFYDGNGNIYRIKQNGTEIARYTYDELNQLIWSADRNTGLYTQFNYDNAGNITSVKEYNLSTTSWAPNGLIAEKTYGYGDSDWKDKLTSYNGTTISYDESGNPTAYRDGMTMSWERGRQLSSLQTADNSVSYKYDSNGMRTQKTDNSGTTYYYYDSDKNLIGLTKDNNTLLFYYDSDGNVTSFKHNGTIYYYIKNLQGDIVKIIDQAGTVIANYAYDVSGKILSIKDGTNNIVNSTNVTHLANLNPFRYRGYVYDNETGLYYLQSRYYDPITGRFLNADVYCDTRTGSPLSTNMFAYCENNFVVKFDKSGQVVETVIDVAGAIWSLVDLIAAPSWLNAGFLIWDVVAIIVPFVPGSYVAKGGKLALKVASKVDDFSKGKKYLTGAYKGLKKVFKGKKGIEIHHLVEKRFKGLFKKVKNTDNYLSVPLSKELHRKITNRWRSYFPYGMNYKKISKDKMRKAIKNIYRDMPQLQKEALKWFEKNWKK